MNALMSANARNLKSVPTSRRHYKLIGDFYGAFGKYLNLTRVEKLEYKSELI
jgi:hypothetical protein